MNRKNAATLKPMKRFFCAVVLCSGAIAVVPGKAWSQASCTAPIKFGVTTPLTTDLALQGVQVKYGLEAAAAEINAKGGIAGKPIQLAIEDTGSSTTLAISALNRVLADRPVAVFSSMISPQNFAQSDIIKRERVPFIVAGTNARLTDQGIPFLFRIHVHDGQIAGAVARYLSERVRISKPGILAVADDFGLGAIKNIRDALGRHNITPVAVETYAPTDRDMTAQLLKIKDANAQALILWGRPADLTIIMRQKRQLGIDMPIFGSTSIATEANLMNLTADETNGTIVFGGVLPNGSEDPKVRAWYKSLSARNKIPPDNWTVAYYDGMYLMKHVIEKVGCDANSIQKELAHTKGFHGLTLDYSVDAKGQLATKIAVYQLKNKTPALLELISE